MILSVSFLLKAFSQQSVKIMEGEIEYLFNERLSELEMISLQNGEVVCNSIGKLKYARINQIPETRQLIDSVKKVNPNHLAEIIKILPYEGYEDLTEIVSEMLKDEKSYTSIPFYVNNEGKTVYLYADAKIQSIVQNNEKEIITEKFLMKPLDYYTAEIESEKMGNYFFYSMKNKTRVRYRSFFSAIGKEKMIAVISIFHYGENWIIYALGGVDIIKLPFIDKKVDRAFYKRIKTFCLFTFERLEEFVSKGAEN
ncbi:DUF6675 family protein [Treponema sp.]|uniref:DUF6675 family protein n=1 Tax=Treponema sp. TaxID=166 RepID=UPI003890DD00